MSIITTKAELGLDSKVFFPTRQKLYNPNRALADADEARTISNGWHAVWASYWPAAFLAVNAADLAMTNALIKTGSFYEANPAANFFIERWGFIGMAFFKAAVVMFVMLVVNFIADRATGAARRVMRFGTIAVGAVVVYSLYLWMCYYWFGIG